MAAGQTLYEVLGVPGDQAYFAGAVAAGALLTGVGFAVRAQLKKREQSNEVLPEGRLSLLNIFVEVVDSFQSLVRNLMGKAGEKYLPIIVTTFLFILIGNLAGMVAGLNSPTANINNNLGMGLVIFILYHYFGVKEHGAHYLKQFTGGLPVPGYGLIMTSFLAFIGVMLLFLESISHLLRPLTLSLRLWGVINGDHLLVNVIYGILPFPLTLLIPMLALALGLVVSVVQALVFTLLSSVYIKLAISHDH